jgi:hypothetical protein
MMTEERTIHKVEMHMDDLGTISDRLEAAHDMVRALCHGDQRWVMSVPAQPKHDPDMVISAALRDSYKLMLALDGARAQLAAAHAREARLGDLLTGAMHALRSYQHGNSSTVLAREMADRIGAALRETEGAE